MIGFITGLPRTRSYWFSQYLDGIEGITAHHEALNGCRSEDDFIAIMERGEHVINCDSAIPFSGFESTWPDAPVVVIRRAVSDVFDSLAAFFQRMGFPEPDLAPLLAMDEALDYVEGLHVEFDDIDVRIQEIHEHLGVPFDDQYAAESIERNLQMPELRIDMGSYVLGRLS